MMSTACFAATARCVADHHFDAVYDAYLADDEVRDFIDDHNPAALREIAERIIGDGHPSGPEMLARLRATLEKQIGLTEAKIEAMQKDLDELQESRQRLIEMCEGCEVPFSRENCDPCAEGHGPLSKMVLGLL